MSPDSQSTFSLVFTLSHLVLWQPAHTYSLQIQQLLITPSFYLPTSLYITLPYLCVTLCMLCLPYVELGFSDASGWAHAEPCHAVGTCRAMSHWGIQMFLVEDFCSKIGAFYNFVFDRLSWWLFIIICCYVYIQGTVFIQRLWLVACEQVSNQFIYVCFSHTSLVYAFWCM